MDREGVIQDHQRRIQYHCGGLCLLPVLLPAPQFQVLSSAQIERVKLSSARTFISQSGVAIQALTSSHPGKFGQAASEGSLFMTVASDINSNQIQREA